MFPRYTRPEPFRLKAGAVEEAAARDMVGKWSARGIFVLRLTRPFSGRFPVPPGIRISEAKVDDSFTVLGVPIPITALSES
ncbi:hypothetical protein NN561_006430 [Cricetulus griseus]